MFILKASLTALMMTSATAAMAAPACSTGDITLAAISCAGFYDGNVNGGDSSKISIQQDALELLGLSAAQIPTGYSPVASAGSVNNAGEIVFNETLYGMTYIGIHFGGGAKKPGSSAKIFANGTGGGTAFYSFDAGSGLNSIKLNISAYSNAVVYRTGSATPPPPPPPPPAVPEPATWAMLLLGFGLVGTAARRRRRVAVTA